MGDRAQSAKRGVSPLGAQLEFLSDVLAGFMIPAVGKPTAGLFQGHFHVRNDTIIQLGHGTSPAIARAVSSSCKTSFAREILASTYHIFLKRAGRARGGIENFFRL